MCTRRSLRLSERLGTRLWHRVLIRRDLISCEYINELCAISCAKFRIFFITFFLLHYSVCFLSILLYMARTKFSHTATTWHFLECLIQTSVFNLICLASTVLTNCFEGIRCILRYTVASYMIDKHVCCHILCPFIENEQMHA